MVSPKTKGSHPTILVVHGPNLNVLGLREPEIYGRTSLAEINSTLEKLGKQLGLKVRTFQSNSEGAIIDTLHSARTSISGLMINPAGYTHTSVAIRDALLLLDVPVIEVHLSNIHKRETFRQHSMTAGVATGQIMGFGPQSYYLALQGLAALLKENR
jgi:3-dehydroquinate dehydratase-2